MKAEGSFHFSKEHLTSLLSDVNHENVGKEMTFGFLQETKQQEKRFYVLFFHPLKNAISIQLHVYSLGEMNSGRYLTPR